MSQPDFASLSDEELAAQIQANRQILMRRSPGGFAQVLSEGESEPWLPFRHLVALDALMVRCALHGRQRVIVSMPPRHGKSELVSRWAPAWYLTVLPNKRVMLCSYEADFAASWGRKARDIIENHKGETGVEVSRLSSSASRWDIDGHAGGMVTAGVGGPISGKGAHLLIIDDPIKNYEEAHSAVEREKKWDWFQSTAYPRLEPDASIIVVMTRWHEDDLAGRLLKDQPGVWTEVKLTALAEDDDPLGREPGEALCPERFPAEVLEVTRKTIGADNWNSLYQQSPNPESGGRFKKSTFRYWRPDIDEDGKRHYLLDDPDGITRVRAEDCWRFVTSDLAVTATTRSDWTVVGVWDMTPDGKLILVHRERLRVEGPEHDALFKRIDAMYNPTWIGIEEKQFGFTVIQSLARDGVTVRPLKADGDKWVRSETAAQDLENGRVYFPRNASWRHEWEEELLAFNHGKHDDQVDVLSYACIERARGMRGRRRRPHHEPVTLEERVAAHLRQKRVSVHPMLGSGY